MTIDDIIGIALLVVFIVACYVMWRRLRAVQGEVDAIMDKLAALYGDSKEGDK